MRSTAMADCELSITLQ